MKIKKIMGWTVGLFIAAWLGTVMANVSVGPTNWYLAHFPGHWQYTVPLIAFVVTVIIIGIIFLFKPKNSKEG